MVLPWRPPVSKKAAATATSPIDAGRPDLGHHRILLPPIDSSLQAIEPGAGAGGHPGQRKCPPASGALGVGADEQEAGSRRLLGKRRWEDSPVQPSSSEESSTARSRRRIASHRMDPSQSSGGGASQGTFSGPNNGAFQGQWNPYMFAYQPPPPRGWVPQTFQSYGANVGMMNPSSYGPEGFQQTQPTEAYVHNAEDDVQEVPPPTAARKKKSATRVKLSNFNPDEDKNLVKSWLEVSCDPITSTGQKKDRMWQRILERYETRRGNKPPRTLRSLQSRWDTIRAECNVFARHYANSIRENPSGMSDADKTAHAVANFSGIEERKFIYLHCWELLKDAPKWQDGSSRDHITAARGEGFGEDAVEDVGGQPSSLPSAAAARRPMGRDAAKAAKKKANSDAGSSSFAEYVAKLQDLSLLKHKFNEDESPPVTGRSVPLSHYLWWGIRSTATATAPRRTLFF